jgi:hypothetical protein
VDYWGCNCDSESSSPPCDFRFSDVMM